MVKDGEIVRRCFELAYAGCPSSFREHRRETAHDREAWLIPVRIVAVRLVQLQIPHLTSYKAGGGYSTEERDYIRALVDAKVEALLDGSEPVPSELPKAPTGIYRHRSEQRYFTKDVEARYGDRGVHRIAREGGRVLRKNHFELLTQPAE